MKPLRPVLAASMAIVLLGAAQGSAQAYTRQATATPTTMTSNWTGEGTIRATLDLGWVSAGHGRNLRSEIRVGDGRSAGRATKVVVGHKITCERKGGGTLANTSTQYGQIWSGQNLLPGGADQTLMVRMVFKPATSGDYQCRLRAYVQDFDANKATLATAAIRSGFVGQIGGDLAPGTFSDNATASQQYFALGSSARRVFSTTYRPASSASSFLAVGDLYATSCYGTCAGTTVKGGYAKIYHRLEATPQYPSSSCVKQSTAGVVTNVSYVTHHLRIPQSLTVKTTGSCGSWTVSDVVASASGATNPFTIFGNPYTSTYARPSL